MKKPLPQLYDINSLLDGDWSQFLSLLAFSYPQPILSKIRTQSNEQLIQFLESQSVANDRPLVEIAAAMPLDKNCYAILAFVDQLFSNYIRISQLHPDIGMLLNCLRPILVISLLNETLPWMHKSVAALTNTIYQHSIGWQPELGRAGVRFFNQLTTSIDGIKYTDKQLQKTLDSLNASFTKDVTRIDKLESRLRDAEIGVLHARHAHQLSAKTLNQKMAGKKLPPAITQFLQGPWRESMRLLIINKGKDSAEWKRSCLLTETLISSVQPIDTKKPEQKQHIVNSISGLSEELRELTIGLHHSGNIDQELSLIEQQHLKVLTSKPLSYAPFILIDNTDPLISSTASISSTLLAKVSSLSEGQWFIHHSEHGNKRIKLCVKISHARQLLFTNFLGIKVTHTSFEDFAYLISSKIVTPISSLDPLRATGEKITAKLVERHKQKIKQTSDEAEIEKEAALQARRTREAAREKALKEAVASREARINAPLFPIRPETNAGKNTKPFLPSAYKSSKLYVGAKVEFVNDGGEKKLYKLAAIIQSSQQYVFVDRLGVKKLSLSNLELDEMIKTKTAKVIDQGSTFEGALEKVVNNLRDRKNL